MRSLIPAQVIGVWERGQSQDNLARALTLLSAAYPEKTREELSALSIGRRDALLLDLREGMFSGTLDAWAECPECAASLEYTLSAGNLRFPETEPKIAMLQSGGLSLRLRSPDSTDLAAASRCGNLEAARHKLVERCVIEALRDDEALEPSELPDEILERAAAVLAESDPGADLTVSLNCSECGHAWQVAFDIAAYLWAEINALAKRLLTEVHLLGQAYGWSERDILAMSAARRHFYLTMVS
jgi:hypothetical protein